MIDDFHTKVVLPKRLTKRDQDLLDYKESLFKYKNYVDIPDELWHDAHTDGGKMAIFVKWKTVLDNNI